MASQAVEQFLLPVLMSELLTDDNLFTSLLLREYSRDIGVEEILKLEGYVHIIVPGYSGESFRRGVLE